ncbi:AAA family ATPase [Lignipirellula cremea]|uniref:DNA replication and repair protein RecF n=1 Tax=Lignipirellula cremea TaxID=2528010 RepID=A0A518E3W6_9BACT|nr:AAA family ATPase [Lignipirellula cremea]QDU98790.1 DNA replication and repair protein RecF [Lignipirellula cremea]
MFVESISLENIRTFAAEKTLKFNHPDRQYGQGHECEVTPSLKNINLLFGENACGKTTLLEAVALAALGPSVIESRIAPRPLIRFSPATRKPSSLEKKKVGRMRATFALHDAEVKHQQGESSPTNGFSEISVSQKGELESFHFMGSAHINWDEVYRSRNDSFFVVAYGATRRVDSTAERMHSKSRRSGFARVERVESIVEEGYPVVSLPAWFSSHKKNSSRWKQVVDLINGALGRGHFVFEGNRSNDDFVFSQGGMEIPFRSLSDGYKAFLGWVTDLLFHLDLACERSELRLDEVSGIVMVDEIDLHLHPTWQMEVIGHLSKTFPRLQFIFTSHSPLIAGSVEWMNITRLRLDRQHRTGIDPFEQPIHGLDADQILVSDLFGLKTTRAAAKNRQLDELTRRARAGDDEAAKQLIAELARGTEGEL